MAQIKWLMVLVMMAMLPGVVAPAAAGEVPPDSVGPDTVFIIYADARHLSPAQLRTAAFTILGDNVGQANDFIASFTDRFEKATAAGVDSITVVGTSTQRIADAGDELAADPKAKRRNFNPPVVYFHLKGAGDVKALEKLMTQDMADTERQQVVFAHEEDWAIMHRKNQSPPAKFDDARARTFNEALATIQEAAIGLVIVPDARMKTDIDKQAQRQEAPKLAKGALPILSTSKWITLAVALGNDPGLKMTANTADTRSAGQLRDAVDTALDELRNPADNAAGPMLLIGTMLAPIIDGVKPIINGNKVTSSLNGDGLKTVANLVTMLRAMTPAAKPPGAAKPPQE